MNENSPEAQAYGATEPNGIMAEELKQGGIFEVAPDELIVAATEDPGLMFRPLCSLSGGRSSSKQFHEREIQEILTEYYSRLSSSLQQSFAPPESIVDICLSGHDPQLLFLMSKNGKTVADRVRGLIVFNQESAVNTKPVIDEAKVQVQCTRETKVLLHHISAVDENKIEDIIDLGLDYIWKTMHCSSIKVNLRHYM